MNQPACLNASEARAYLRVSERQWNKLVAAGLVKKLPTLGSYSRAMLDDLIRAEEQLAKTVVRLRLEENDEADTEEGRTMDGAGEGEPRPEGKDADLRTKRRGVRSERPGLPRGQDHRGYPSTL